MHLKVILFSRWGIVTGSEFNSIGPPLYYLTSTEETPLPWTVPSKCFTKYMDEQTVPETGVYFLTFTFRSKICKALNLFGQTAEAGQRSK